MKPSKQGAKMRTLKDVWDMERDVMDFYDSLMKASRSSQQPEQNNLKAMAFEVVMKYRTVQVELVNNMASIRKTTIAGLGLLPDSDPLTISEASVVTMMKGLFALHQKEMQGAIEKAIFEGQPGVEIDTFKSILQEAGYEMGNTAKGNEDGR